MTINGNLAKIANKLIDFVSKLKAAIVSFENNLQTVHRLKRCAKHLLENVLRSQHSALARISDRR